MALNPLTVLISTFCVGFHIFKFGVRVEYNNLVISKNKYAYFSMGLHTARPPSPSDAINKRRPSVCCRHCSATVDAWPSVVNSGPATDRRLLIALGVWVCLESDERNAA